jgi:ATP-dependent Lon protease
MELLQLIHDLVPEGDETEVRLVTQSDPESCVKQEEFLNQMVEAFAGSRVVFSWEFDHNPNFHARSITTDTGWKILIDRGLDMFQKFETGPFSLEQATQDARLTRRVEITFLRNDENV